MTVHTSHHLSPPFHTLFPQTLSLKSPAWENVWCGSSEKKLELSPPWVALPSCQGQSREFNHHCLHLGPIATASPARGLVPRSNVGLSGFLSVPAGPHSPLSHPSLQPSLSNPNLQASLRSPQPQLQGSHSHPSLPASSLARHALPAASLGHPSLSAPALSSSSSCSSTSPPGLGAPPYSASTPGASPRHHRRVPLSPLSLPAGPADARRSQQQLPKQFSPTMSPTLSSITQVCVLPTLCVSLSLLPTLVIPPHCSLLCSVSHCLLHSS